MVDRRVTLLLVAALGGCATLTPEQCRQADWYELGARDALAGSAPGIIDSHARACDRAGVVPDAALWQAGYNETLPRFCVGAYGYRLGARDGTYHGQCPPELEREFLDGFRLGQDVHDLEGQIREVEENIERLRQSMRDEHATEASREADGRWLEHYKDERERLQRRLWNLQDRARERGY